MEYERIKWFREYFKKSVGEGDPKFQEYFEKDLEKAFKRASQLLAVSEEELLQEKPITIYLPYSIDTKSGVNHKLAKKEDGYELEYDQSIVDMVFFGETRLYYYQTTIDHRFPLFLDDVAGEVQYFDIVNVLVVNELDDYEDPKNELVTLKLWLCDGSEIPFTLRRRLFTGELEEVVLTEEEAAIIKYFKDQIRQHSNL